MNTETVAQVALLVAVGANSSKEIEEVLYRLQDVKIAETPGDLYLQAANAVRELHIELWSVGSNAWTKDVTR